MSHLPHRTPMRQSTSVQTAHWKLWETDQDLKSLEETQVKMPLLKTSWLLSLTCLSTPFLPTLTPRSYGHSPVTKLASVNKVFSSASWRKKHSWSVVWMDETQAYNGCLLSFTHSGHRTGQAWQNPHRSNFSSMLPASLCTSFPHPIVIWGHKEYIFGLCPWFLAQSSLKPWNFLNTEVRGASFVIHN